MAKRIKHLSSGIGILGLAGGIIFGITQLPAPDTSRPAAFRPSLISADGGTMNLICTGNVQALFPAGASSEAVSGTQEAAIESAANGIAFAEEDNTSQNRISLGDTAGFTWHSAAESQDQSAKGKIIDSPVFGTATGLAAGEFSGMSGVLALARDEITAGAVGVFNSHRAVAGDLRGLATNPCVWAENSAWFVGLQAGVGISNQLRIVNPSANPIVVTLAAFNSLGKAPAGANANVALASGEIKTISLDGILRADERIVLHLSSANGFLGRQSKAICSRGSHRAVSTLSSRLFPEICL
ncbi:DUF5719 family protein [Arcanobacterium hippocoleae]